MPRFTTMFAATVAVAVCASVILPSVLALPFGKNSAVVELTPATLTTFLNTHKPVYIMFYAPWCGHCKSAHPEWETFAKNVKDVVRVGAIDADKYREVGGQFGVKGFPTIKYWKIGSKKKQQPQDYNGQRSSGAFQNAALAEVTAVAATATSIETVRKELAKASLHKAAVLFTSKTKSPPMFSVLSHSPHFAGKIAFIVVNEKLKAVVSELGAKAFPSVAVVQLKEAGGDDSGAAGFQTTFFDGKFEYTALAKFLQKEGLGVETASGAESDAEDDAKAGGSTAKKETPKKKSAKPSASGTDEEPAAKEAAPPPTKRTPASPVRPIVLNETDFKTFCGPDAPKVRQSQPFCVVSFKPDIVDFDVIHSRYANEAVHFFFPPNDDGLVTKWMGEMGEALQPKYPLERHDIVVLRFTKDRTKYVVFRDVPAAETETTTIEDRFDAFLSRAISGDTTFSKSPGFPVLSPAA